VIFPEPSTIEPEPQDADYIRWVQSSLNRILGLRLTVDGIMEPETRSAIRSFQKRQGLPVTGIVGPETDRALVAAGADQPPPTEELQGEVSRSSRDYIRWVQSSLNKILGLRLAVDGIMGQATRSAIRSFQQRRGLVADGIVGPKTEQALLAGGASPLGVVSGQPRKGPRVVLIPGVLGSAIADRSLTPAQARAICEKNVGRKISPSGPFYPCSRRPELLWGGIGSLHWFFDATAWGQRMRSGNGWDNGGSVAPAGLFEIDIKLRSTRIELKPYASLITTLRQAGADVLVFAYDWRLSNTHNAALLAREILRTWFGGTLPQVSPPREQRITFIGHSMGGLLARYLLETQPLWAGLARRLITIGTPHRGAPQAFLHFIGRTFPFPRAPYYGWVPAPLSAGARLLPAPVQTAVFKSMASAGELMPVYNFVQGKSGLEAYRDTYRGQIHPPTGKPVLDIIDNFRRRMIHDLQLEDWLRMRMLDYHCLAATGVETVSGYDRNRYRVLTTRDGDGSVPRSSALPVSTASSRLHLKTLATGGHAHARLCERKDVQAYILSALRDVARAAPHTAHAAKSRRAFGEQLIQPDDFAAMARRILSGEPLKPLGVGDVLCITRLMAGDGGGPLINAETERVGTKLMLKNPPKHIVSREVFSVLSPRHGLFQYVWIRSTGSGISRGGMLFLPKPRPHELHHAYLVTFNPERLDKRFANACTNAHHAEMQLVGWVMEQDWQARLGTVLISNRSRTKNRGYSPCASCCDDLAWFLRQLKNLPRRSGRPVTVEAGISWLTLYTYAKICPSHPTTHASLRLMHDSGWKLGGPGWTTPPPAQQPIRRPARPSPVPAHIP
jgi:peptidoglycan hydrolase-like protein with peptidoglycan-binding domain